MEFDSIGDEDSDNVITFYATDYQNFKIIHRLLNEIHTIQYSSYPDAECSSHVLADKLAA